MVNKSSTVFGWMDRSYGTTDIISNERYSDMSEVQSVFPQNACRDDNITRIFLKSVALLTNSQRAYLQ